MYKEARKHLYPPSKHLTYTICKSTFLRKIQFKSIYTASTEKIQLFQRKQKSMDNL